MVKRSRYSKRRYSKRKTRNRKRSNKKNKHKRKSRMMRLSRAGMRGEEGDEEDQVAWERLVQEERIRTTAQFPGPGEPGTPRVLTKYVDYVNEVYLCKSHCDKIMHYSYNGGEGSVKCDFLNIKKAYQKQSKYHGANVYERHSVEGEYRPCSVCENKKKGDASLKECIKIGNCRWCISDECSSYLPLKNFTDCEVCRV